MFENKCSLDIAGLTDAFNAFMDESFEAICIRATKANWWGNGYKVELFNDGTYRYDWDQNFGNLYYSPGLVLQVEVLNDEEFDNDDENNSYINRAREVMEDKFKDIINGIKESTNKYD